MKKTISLLLSLVMLFSITAGLDFSAFASTYYESEDNGSYSSADLVPVNSTIYGTCSEIYNDDDWYKFTLSSDGKVDVKFSFTRADISGCWNVDIYKYEGNGNFSSLDNNSIYCYDGSYTFSSLGLPAGTYFVQVYTTSPSLEGKQYSITPNCTYTSNWETEFNNNYASADPLTFGTTRYGVCTYAYSDDDWYKFTLNSSGKIKVSFSHTKLNQDGYWNVYIYKYNGSGSYSTIDSHSIYCNDGTYTFPSLGLSKGTYFIEVYTNSSYSVGEQYGVTVNYAVPTPSTLKVSTRNTTSLKLSWSKVSGASGYQLQQKSGDTYKTKKTTTSTSYTVSNLSAGKNYSFRVRAYKTVDGKKYYSGWKYLTTCAKPKTASLSKLTAYKSGHKIKATWKKVGGTASGYQIYWAKDKSFKKVVAKTTVSGQSKTSYTGKNFTKGKKYYVKIRAYKTVNGTKYYGAWSNVKSITAK